MAIPADSQHQSAEVARPESGPSLADLMVAAHSDPTIHALLVDAKNRTLTTPAVRDEPEDFEKLRRSVTGG